MSRLSYDSTIQQEVVRAALLGGIADALSDAAAITALPLTITFTTDDPSYTPDGALTIADGDSPTALEQHSYAAELADQYTKLLADVTAVRTKLNQVIGGPLSAVSPLSALTVMTPASTTRLVGITFTTDNPAITADGTVVIADGDLTTAVEFLHFLEEANNQLMKLRSDLTVIYGELNKIISTKSFAGVNALATTAGASGFVTITWTTDNPSITADQEVIIADGDTITAAERNSYMVEIDAVGALLRTDIAAMRTAFAAFLAKAGIS